MLKRILLFLLSCTLLPPACMLAQQPLNPADGNFTQNFGTDSINLQSLAITVKAPVLSKPGAIPFMYSLIGSNGCQGAVLNGTPNVVCGYLNQYFASMNCEITYCTSLWPVTAAGVWSIEPQTTLSGQVCGDGGVYTKFSNFILLTPDGSTYSLPSTAYAQYEAPGHGTGACNHSFTAYTTNGGIVVSSDTRGNLSSLTLPNGTVYNGALTDTFGNTISPVSGGYSDTLGVNPALSITAQSGSTGEIDTYKDTGGTAHQIKQVLTLETLKTTFGCTAWPDQTLSGRYAVTQVQYPDGNNINLQYETVTGGITGRLSQITLRTGGTVSYSYGSMNCGSMIPSTLSRTTVDGTSTYTFAMNGTHGTTTTVLDPGKNKTVYTFQGTDSNGLPVVGTPLTLTQVQVYQNTGTVSSPIYALLSTTIYCYNNNTTNCPTTQAAYPILHKDIYTAPGSKTTYSRTHYDYDTGCGGSCGLVTNVVRYASFVAIGAGTADNTTAITYGSWNGSSCVAVGSGIINLPCEEKTTSGANTLSDTRHTYSAKGFQTQAQQWTNANGWMTMAQASPNTNGTVASTTNNLGLTTTYSYADCNAMLPTGSSKTVNGVTLTTSATWDCNMGKLLTSTGYNTGETATFTYDLLGRPSSQEDPTGYTLTEGYPSATSSTLTDSTYFTTTKTGDGLGRLIRSQTTDGANYDTVSTQYEFNGTDWQINTSQPCITTLGADCTLNHYVKLDPLSRTFYSSTASNEVVNTAFNQNDVSVSLTPAPSGENNKTAQTEVDGMGRPLSICALEATGGTTCGQVDGNSGILTAFTYSYSAGGTTVTATRGSQSHATFSDQLARVKSFTLPESGTTNNYYDVFPSACTGGSSSTGNLVCSVDPNGEETIYLYDTMNRLTDVNADDSPNGNCRRYRYDATGNGFHGAPTGYSGTNILGRVMEAETDNCVSPFTAITDEWFAYDLDGRVTDVWESTPHSGGWYHTQATYAINGQLATLSGLPGTSTYTITLDTNGRPDSSKYGTQGVVGNVNWNAAGQPTEVDFQGSDKDTYTFDSNTGFMTGWAFTLGTTTETATLTWNPNRTLKKLAITDGFNSGGTQTCNYNPTDHTGTGYDDVERLIGVYCGTPWNQTYTYDQYDNITKAGTTNWNPGYSSTSNHITGASYDSDGQVTYDLNNSFAWDGYHKMITANAGSSLGSCGASGVTCITYDAFGRFVEENVGGTINEYVYMPTTSKPSKMSGQTLSNFRFPLPGGAVGNGTSASNFIVHHQDWVGSYRLTSNLTSHAMVTDAAYSPYGESYAHFGTSGNNTFAGLFQDTDFGVTYNTPNREFDFSSGSRWLSPDPAGASWNSYSYPTNPNSFTDPSGLNNCSFTERHCGNGNSGLLMGSLDLGGSLFGDSSLTDYFLTGQLSTIPVTVVDNPFSVNATPPHEIGELGTWDAGTGTFSPSSIVLSNGTTNVDIFSLLNVGNDGYLIKPPQTPFSKPGKPGKAKKSKDWKIYILGAEDPDYEVIGPDGKVIYQGGPTAELVTAITEAIPWALVAVPAALWLESAVLEQTTGYNLDDWLGLTPPQKQPPDNGKIQQ